MRQLRHLGPSGDTNGRGVAVDALSMVPGNVAVNLLVIGLDGRKRIYLLAAVSSIGLIDSDRSNDVWLAWASVGEFC